MKKIILSIITFISLHAVGQNWENVGNLGITSGQEGRAIIEYNGNLIMGGKFEQMDGVAARNIAQWDGTGWTQLGDGIDGDVRCMAVYNGELYIGGNISQNGALTTDLPSVCKLENNVWVGVSDEAVVGIADDMMVWNNELYVVSNDWSLPNKIMKYDGTTWSQVGPDIGQYGDNHSASCIGVYNDTLYVGGRFADLNGSGANRLAKLSGGNWVSVGFPVPGEENNIIAGWVNDIIEFEGQLFVGGVFSDFTGTSLTTNPRLASFDGTTWTGHAFDMNSSGDVKTLLVHDSVLYVGGEFSHWEESIVARGVLIFNPEDQNSFVTTGFATPGFASAEGIHLGVFNSSVYLTGDFDEFGTSGTSAGIARFNGMLPSPFTSIMERGSDMSSFLFPNPSSGILNLHESDGYLTIFDWTGKQVYHEQMTTKSIHLNSLARGVYIARWTKDSEQSIQRIVLN